MGHIHSAIATRVKATSHDARLADDDRLAALPCCPCPCGTLSAAAEGSDEPAPAVVDADVPVAVVDVPLSPVAVGFELEVDVPCAFCCSSPSSKTPNPTLPSPSASNTAYTFFKNTSPTSHWFSPNVCLPMMLLLHRPSSPLPPRQSAVAISNALSLKEKDIVADVSQGT